MKSKMGLGRWQAESRSQDNKEGPAEDWRRLVLEQRARRMMLVV